MKRVALLVLAVLAGCPVDPPVREFGDAAAQEPSQEMIAHVATTLALHTISTPTPSPAPSPAPSGHERAKCPTGGWMVHADGHKTRCPECVPAWSADEPPPVPESSPRPPGPVAPAAVPGRPAVRPSAPPVRVYRRPRILPWRQ